MGHRDSVMPEDNFASLIDALDLHSLRFPGGSVTETYYSIEEPDRTEAIDPATGEGKAITPLSDFFAFAYGEGVGVTITLPTRHYLSAIEDSNGDRFADIEEDLLRNFINEVLTETYGKANVTAFEIGNEYWGSGQMSAVEYGRLSSEMSRIISQTLDELAKSPGFERPQIYIQMGTNFNFSSLDEQYLGTTDETLAELSGDYGIMFTEDAVKSNGDIAWTRVNNQLILNEYDTVVERNSVNGVIVHLFSRDPALPGQRDFQLNVVKEMWVDSGYFENLDIYVSEWNLSGSSSEFERRSDYGLYQAQEMLNILEAFSYWGVDQAAIWPLVQNTPNTLAAGWVYDSLTPAGEFFRIMADTLPGMAPIDFNAQDGVETELRIGDVSVHGFYASETLVLFAVNSGHDTTNVTIDLSSLISASGIPKAVLLGVSPGDAPGDNASSPVLTRLQVVEFLNGDYLIVDLQPGEILQATFDGYIPTIDFFDAISAHEESMDNTAVSPVRELISGTDSDDRIEVFGAHRVDGGPGLDTLVLSGQQSNYTLSFAGDMIIVDDRRLDANGPISASNVERLEFAENLSTFGTDSIRISDFDGMANLHSEAIVSLAELYIAYFDRAPDALGLLFWGNKLSEGMSLEDIADAFFDQTETKELYGEVTNLATFITSVYQNVLGRDPDAAGMVYWQNIMAGASQISIPTFIHAVLGGAKAETGDIEDATYLTRKVDLGMHFAIANGLSDVQAARNVMAVFNGTIESLQKGIARSDATHAETLAGDGFIVRTVGYVDYDLT